MTVRNRNGGAPVLIARGGIAGLAAAVGLSLDTPSLSGREPRWPPDGPATRQRPSVDVLQMYCQGRHDCATS